MSAATQLLGLAITDRHADSHSAAPEPLGQSPTAASTAKGSASSIPTTVMVLRFPCRLNGSYQRVSADQGSDRDSTGVAPKSTFANRDLIAWVGLEVKPRIGRRYGAALVKSRRACVGYPNGSSTPRRLGWSARAAGGGGAVGTAARPGINHAALAATRIGIAAGPGRRTLRRRCPATVDPQSCSRTRHRAQHGCGRFRAARG